MSTQAQTLPPASTTFTNVELQVSSSYIPKASSSKYIPICWSPTPPSTSSRSRFRIYRPFFKLLTSFLPTNGYINQPFGLVPRLGQDVRVKPQEPENDMTSLLTWALEEALSSPPPPKAVTLQAYQHRLVQRRGRTRAMRQAIGRAGEEGKAGKSGRI